MIFVEKVLQLMGVFKPIASQLDLYMTTMEVRMHISQKIMVFVEKVLQLMGVFKPIARQLDLYLTTIEVTMHIRQKIVIFVSIVSVTSTMLQMI
jgi:hypothetical protein